MQTFNRWNVRIIVVSAILGGIYGHFATLNVRGISVAPWELIVSSLCTAALCACAGSAIFRFLHVWYCIHQTEKRPIDVSRRINAASKMTLLLGERHDAQSPRYAPPQSPSVGC